MTIVERMVAATASIQQSAPPDVAVTPLVEVTGLSVGFPVRSGELTPVLRDISFTLQPGEQLGIVGESGCGKSTLALALLGHLRPNGTLLSGSVRLAGHDPFTLSPRELERLRGGTVALVPQSASLALTPTMRVGDQVAETIALHTPLRGRAARERVADLFAAVHLPDPTQIARRYPHQLSGGQQQRVAIAMALAGVPALLVLDEPTTGLDVTTQAAVLALLGEVRERTGVATVYVSHDLGVIARVAERLLVMYAGEVVEEGPVDAVFARPAHPYTRGLLASLPRLSWPGLPAAMAGQAPRPEQWPRGCAFSPRCPLAAERCWEEHPALLPVALMSDKVGARPQRRRIRCHHWERAIAGEGDSAAPEGIRRSLRTTLQDGWRQVPIVLELEEVAATYARPSLGSSLNQLRGKPEAPRAVAGISLELRRGETLALVGESGSGKSTIARLVAGLLAPSDGAVRFAGEPLADLAAARTKEFRRRIQLVFQNPDASLNPRQTVDQILDRPLALFSGLGRAARRERAAALLDEVRLDPAYLSRFPGQLSGGEKQRVAIARAFAAEPDLVLCDEVTSALDVSVQAAILGLLARLQQERGTAYLLVAHDLAVVRAVADSVIVLHKGQIVEAGPADDIFASPRHPYTAALLDAAPPPIRHS